jgi:hypothetical protein
VPQTAANAAAAISGLTKCLMATLLLRWFR